MKKKLLIAVMVAVVVCLFAFSVSAAGSTSNEFAEVPETIDGIATPSKIGTSERVVMLGNDGLYYTFPAYYILNDNTSCSFKTNNSVNSALGYADGTSHKSYVVRIEIPTGVTYINGYFLNGNTNLVYAKMSDTVTDTGTKVFQDCTSLETLVLSNSLTIIQNDLCKGCSKLTSPIVIPSTVTEIKGYCFDGCKITSITNYAENVTSIASNAFSGCPITEFNFPDKLTEIGQYAFNGAQFTSVDLPNTITTLGTGVFQGCTKLTYVRLPERLTQLPHDFMKNTTSSSITIVVPKGCTSIYSQYSLQNTGISKIIFTGASTDAFVASVQEKASGWVSKIVYENHCDHYYDGVHEEDNNPCVINCTRCNTQGAAEKNPIHDELVVITYTSYTVAGTRVVDCQNEGCGHHIDGTANPLFVCNGYSIPDDERIGIAVSYKVDKNAVAEYKALNNDFEYGVFAVLESKIGTNDIIKQDGTLTTSSVCANLTGEPLAAVTLKIVGFTTDADKALSLAMGIYVKKAEEDQSKYTYIQVASPEEGQKYSFISYNEVTQ